MAFIQPCFIRKKTQELIDKLITMGYNYPIKYQEIFPNLLTVPYKGHGWASLIAVSDKEIDLALKTQINQNPTIDCGDNEELFLALAALRDDKPDYQWYVWNDIFVDNRFKQYIPGEHWEEWWWFEIRKATVEEIIEHFKK